MKHTGKQYRFIYPNYGTPSGYPEHVSHSGQTVTVEEKGVADWQGLYRVTAPDGWSGWVRDDELNPLHPRKGNIVRVNHPEHVNNLFKVESVTRDYVGAVDVNNGTYFPNFPRKLFGI